MRPAELKNTNQKKIEDITRRAQQAKIIVYGSLKIQYIGLKLKNLPAASKTIQIIKSLRIGKPRSDSLSLSTLQPEQFL